MFIYDHEMNFDNRDMYQAWAFPEIDHEQPPARLENWPIEDVIDFCGAKEVV